MLLSLQQLTAPRRPRRFGCWMMYCFLMKKKFYTAKLFAMKYFQLVIVLCSSFHCQKAEKEKHSVHKVQLLLQHNWIFEAWYFYHHVIIYNFSYLGIIKIVFHHPLNNISFAFLLHPCKRKWIFFETFEKLS